MPGDTALDSLLEGIGEGGKRTGPLPKAPHDPVLDSTLERLTPRTEREQRLMSSLRATEPETGLIKELPMFGAGMGAQVLAGRGLTAADLR